MTTWTLNKIIRHGSLVECYVYAGLGRNGSLTRTARGKAVMRSADGGWVLNMGGAYGTPQVVNENNFVRVVRR